jgi:hypothetical protein
MQVVPWYAPIPNGQAHRLVVHTLLAIVKRHSPATLQLLPITLAEIGKEYNNMQQDNWSESEYILTWDASFQSWQIVIGSRTCTQSSGTDAERNTWRTFQIIGTSPSLIWCRLRILTCHAGRGVIWYEVSITDAFGTNADPVGNTCLAFVGLCAGIAKNQTWRHDQC